MARESDALWRLDGAGRGRGAGGDRVEGVIAPADGRWLGDPDVYHGEGAFWDPVDHVLRYVDMLAGDIITLDGEETTRTHVGDVVALIRRRRGGGFVVALERGFALLDDDLRVEREIPAFADTDARMNEGACDARGRLFCGSMAYDGRADGGRLYRLDPDGTVSVALPVVTVPNGLVWRDGGPTALHDETGAGQVRAYDYDEETGSFGAWRPFVTVPEGEGAPDGSALDAEGGLWVALWGAGRVHRYAPDGTLDVVIEVGVSQPTSVAFGGADGTTLFITTSREDLPAEAEPLAGRVFAVPTAFRGAPVHPFAG